MYRVMCVDKSTQDSQVQISNTQTRRAQFYNMQKKKLEIKVDDFVLLKMCLFSSRWQKRVAKYGPFKISKMGKQ